jgi:hypothetical protein
MLTRPLPSTPQVTGDACGLPSERVVIRMARCRCRANSSIPARSTRVLVAICGDMPASLRPATDRSGDGLGTGEAKGQGQRHCPWTWADAAS